MSVGNNGNPLLLQPSHWSQPQTLYISECGVLGLSDTLKYCNGFMGIYEWLAPPFPFLFSPEGDRHLVCLYVFAYSMCHLEFYIVYRFEFRLFIK